MTFRVAVRSLSGRPGRLAPSVALSVLLILGSNRADAKSS